MKLNNHGWGDIEFILSIVAILIVLLVIAINVHRLYSAIEDTPNDVTKEEVEKPREEDNKETEEPNTAEDVYYDQNYYIKYQNKMIDATRNYIIYVSPSIPSEGLRIELNTLVEKNYINTLNDMVDGNPCGGHSIVSLNEDGSLNIKAYLNCSNYVTEGY